jgi:hypothetical protein
MKFGGVRLQATEISINAQIDKQPSKPWHTTASPRTKIFPPSRGASLFQTHAADPCSLAKIRGAGVRFWSEADIGAATELVRTVPDLAGGALYLLAKKVEATCVYRKPCSH